MQKTPIFEMTENDLEEVAASHSEVFPEDTATALGTRYLVKMYSFFVEKSDRLALVARDVKNNQILGFLVGAPVGFKPLLKRHTAVAVLTSIVAQPRMWFDRRNWKRLKNRISAALWNRNRTERVTTNGPRPDTRTGYIYYLGVSRIARGKGVGAALMSKGEEFFRRLGMKRVTLTVYLVNVPAIRFYKKWGWEEKEKANGVLSILEKKLD